MGNPLLELIQRGNSSITSTQRDLERLETEARADDGVVDENDEEYAEIVQIRGRLTELRRLTQERQSQFDANQAEWDNLSSEITALRADITTLTDWGEPGLAPINGTVSEMDASEHDRCYRDAINAFGTARNSLDPMMVEYRRQFTAKGQYETELAIIEERVATYRREEVSNDITITGLDQIETNLVSAATPTTERDYVEALSLLHLGGSDLSRVEGEIERLKEAKRDTDARFLALTRKVAETETQGQAFPELASRFTQVNTSVSEIEGHMESCDYATAQGAISSVDYELDAIQSEIGRLTDEAAAEAARIAAEREEWERRAPRWTEFKSKVQELGDWAADWGTEGTNFVNQIQGHESAEEFLLAGEALDQAETAITAPWTQHEAQVTAKTTYDDTRPGLDQRVSQARGHEHVDDAATQQLGQIDATLQRMTDSANNQDYIAANAENQSVSAALDTLEALLRENQMRAEVAAEMGEDPNSSNADVEVEVTRRL